MKDEILAGIQQNMRIESVRGEAQPDAPYGPGPKAALEDALELGRKLGFKVGEEDALMIRDRSLDRFTH